MYMKGMLKYVKINVHRFTLNLHGVNYFGGGNMQSSSTRKRISFTEFLTLLRLLTKKVFMNGNDRVTTSSFTVV